MRPSRRFPRRALAALVTTVALFAAVVAPAVPAVAADSVSISGVLFDSTGATAGREHIEAYLPDGGPGWGTLASWDQADLGGEFQLGGLEAGREYRLRINWSGELSSAPSFQGFVTNDPVDRMTQDPSRAALFVPGASGLTGLELRVEPATSMSGRVVSPDGTPLAGIEVTVATRAEYNDIVKWEGRVPTSQATTGEDGTFRIRELEYVGDEIQGYVVRITPPSVHGGYLGGDPASGLVPVDQARVFPAVRDEIAGVNVVVPQVQLPADQILLGRPISSSNSWGQIMAVGSGTLSVFSVALPDGVIEDSLAIRTGFEEERVYAPGDWGGVALDWLGNFNPEASHFEYYDDIVTVDELGDMYLYEGNGLGHLRPPERIGWGWSGYRVIPVGDLDRVLDERGRPDLLAIDRNGDLMLYRGDGEGGFLWPPRQVGNGWIGYDLYSAGDVNLDGRNDILSVDTAGDLWMYAGFGDGTFATRVKVGNGWGTYTLAAGADLDGYMDSTDYPVKTEADIVGRDDATGDLYLYSGLGNGFFDTKRLIATGW